MSPTLAAFLGAIAGAVIVLAVRYLPPEGWRVRRNGERPARGSSVPSAPFRAVAVLEEMASATAVVDGSNNVLFANGAALALGVVRGNRLASSEIRDIVRATRRDGRPRETEIEFAETAREARRPLAVAIRTVAIGGGDIAIIVDDLTEQRRVDAARRDFVANVGHELKTPVGAISLLAEAVADADAETSRHFAERIQQETQRLGRLVQELILLSRLQGADPLPSALPVSLREVVRDAIDRSTAAAGARGIEVRGDVADVQVTGDHEQLSTAIGNLVDNAIAYSEPGTRVAVVVRQADESHVEISVTDEGIGIPADAVDRIFERFYRVDPARSRKTGGTGLGLAIVKHVVANHGGTVSVWSMPRRGSTFTVQLPAAQVIREDVVS